MIITLVVVGAGLVLAGAAHVLLPRVLGWGPDTGSAEGAVSAVVIRLHVGFIGGFLVLIGLVTGVAAPDLAAGGRLPAMFCLATAVLFAARWLSELTLITRAIRAVPSVSRWWRRVHLVAVLLIWPGLTIVYGWCGLQALP